MRPQLLQGGSPSGLISRPGSPPADAVFVRIEGLTAQVEAEVAAGAQIAPRIGLLDGVTATGSLELEAEVGLAMPGIGGSAPALSLSELQGTSASAAFSATPRNAAIAGRSPSKRRCPTARRSSGR